jgi:PAS domain S-box-containing protein
MAKQEPKEVSPRLGHVDDIVSILAEGVIVLDEQGNIVRVNDAALRLHGLNEGDFKFKNIKDYAQSFDLRYRNNHRLEEKAFPAARAVAGENFKDVVVEIRRKGEEELLAVHSITACRSTQPDGDHDIYLIITDLTEKVQAEQRFEAAFNANPAPAIICRLSDLRYVKVNGGFLDMTGFARDEVIGRSAYELDVLAEASKRDLALERLKENRTIPQMEARVPLADSGRKHVIVAGEPLQLGDDACMLFTFADLDPLKATEHALRQSEERFSKSFHLSPVAQMITSRDFKITEINHAFQDVMAVPHVEDVLGTKATEFFLWPDKTAQRLVETSFDKTGCINGLDLKIQTKSGDEIDCLVSAVTVTIAGELCVLWVMQEISDRKRSEEELIAAIEAVMEDTTWFSRSVVEKLAGLRRTTKPSVSAVELDELTARERDILGLICQGASDKDMSDALSLSPNTIRNHISSLFRKLGVNRRAAAIIWARERGVSGRDNRLRSKKDAKRSRK